MIEGLAPSSWRDLQEDAARILRECGMEAQTDQAVKTVRGTVNLDAVALDREATPPASIVLECKHWRKRVPKSVVHGFRTVVADIGANLGLIISSAGFQAGALEAADHTNLNLVDWAGFEEIYEPRWFERYMVPILCDYTRPLFDYTEPYNSRIF
jgi:restriction system protein